MEMRSIADIESIGQDLTPPLYPISHSLYNTHLLSHCSACFSPLSLKPSISLSPPLYCSSLCSSSDSPLHSEHYFLSSDLRAALRLLHRYPNHPQLDRIGGLLSNHHSLLDNSNDELYIEIKDGAKAIRMIMGGNDDNADDDCLMEEAALCVVLTNAVEVQDENGIAVGIAVYDTAFSWINHSCSPNACYRFSEFNDESPMLIAAAAAAASEGGYGGSLFVINWGLERYGPRLGVRNIKPISKGEEITIAYTDLLQTKATRQSELWSKYRFICHCRRCSTLPLPFVDHALEVRLTGALHLYLLIWRDWTVPEDIHVAGLNSTARTSAYNVYRDEVVEILTEYMDGATSEYVKFDDAESCCEKLEHVLAYGFMDYQSRTEEKLQAKIRLQPMHHLSLKAYTVLASAYKTLGSNLLDVTTSLLKHQLNAFERSRISAAYSLLLAGATHYLFLSESSLIISVANYWTAAGESLLSLATSTVQNISMDQGYHIPNISPSKLKCDKCGLKDKFEAIFGSRHSQNLEFEHISRDFLTCVTDIVPQLWMFLTQGSHYLNEIKNPIDFSWCGTKDAKVSDFGANLGSDNVVRSLSRCEQEKWYDNRRINFFQLGTHCILYGELVLKICSGKTRQLVNLS